MKLAHGHNEYFNLDLLKEILFNGNAVKETSECFAVFADEVRVRIFMLLCHTKQCVVNIADFMEMTAPAVSHHLKVLKDAGFIESWRDGKEVFYSVSNSDKGRTMHVIIENLMQTNCPDFERKHEKINEKSEFQDRQIETVKKVHDFMCEHISERFTIEDLARRFGMNTTTLKTVFKDVYGTSLASHIKEHRMEKAAELLAGTDLSISEVASMVGYESQGKFSATFKEFFGMIPSEYKKEKH